MAAESQPEGKPFVPHWSLACVAQFLQTYTPPAGPFQPAGRWSHTYALWSEVNPRQYGTLTMGRRPDGADGIALEIETRVQQAPGPTHCTTARLTRCARRSSGESSPL